MRSKGPNFSKLRGLALDPRKNMPDIEAEVSFVSTIGMAWLLKRFGGHVRKKPTYTKEEVYIQRAVMNHIGIALVENEEGAIRTPLPPYFYLFDLFSSHMWLLTMGVLSMYRSHRGVSEAYQGQIVYTPKGLESILNEHVKLRKVMLNCLSYLPG